MINWNSKIIKFNTILQWNLQYIITYVSLIFLIWIIWLNWYLFIYWNKLFLYYFYKTNWVRQVLASQKQFFTTRKTGFLFKKPAPLNRLSTIYYLFKRYNDTISIIFIWFVGGFPPFILFLTKFYIVCYAWENFIMFTTILVWIIINTLGVYSYIKGISLFIVRFSKEV